MKELIEKLQLAVSNSSNDILLSVDEAKVIVDSYEKYYPKIGLDVTINRPEWLTDEAINMVKELWSTPNINDSNPRIKALQLIKSFASDAGYTVDIKKADEIIKTYCL